MSSFVHALSVFHPGVSSEVVLVLSDLSYSLLCFTLKQLMLELRKQSNFVIITHPFVPSKPCNMPALLNLLACNEQVSPHDWFEIYNLILPMLQLFSDVTYFAIALRGDIFVQHNSKTWYVCRWWSICHWIYPILLHLFANLQSIKSWLPLLNSSSNISIFKNMMMIYLFRGNVTPGPGPVPVIVR